MAIVAAPWCPVGRDEPLPPLPHLDSIVGHRGGVGAYWIIGGGVASPLLFGRPCSGRVGGLRLAAFVIVGVRCPLR